MSSPKHTGVLMLALSLVLLYASVSSYAARREHPLVVLGVGLLPIALHLLVS